MTTANPFITAKYQQYVEPADNELLLKDPQLRQQSGVHVLDELHHQSSQISYQVLQNRRTRRTILKKSCH